MITYTRKIATYMYLATIAHQYLLSYTTCHWERKGGRGKGGQQSPLIYQPES